MSNDSELRLHRAGLCGQAAQTVLLLYPATLVASFSLVYNVFGSPAGGSGSRSGDGGQASWLTCADVSKLE